MCKGTFGSQYSCFVMVENYPQGGLQLTNYN